MIACANQKVLHGFRARLLDAVEGTYEGTLQHDLGREVTRDMDKGITYLSQTHHAEKNLSTYNFWNATPCLKPMHPNTHLNKKDCDKNPALEFHRRYRGIVSSLGYLATMIRPDLAWAYSKLSKCVQFPGKIHMLAAEHVLCYLHSTWNQTIC